MSNTTFANTLLKVTQAGKADRLIQAGEVFARNNCKTEAWGDTMVLGISNPDKWDTIWVRMARPYAYASCVGTMLPGVLVGTEVYEVTAKDLVAMFTQKVGRPMVTGSKIPIERGYDSEIVTLAL